MSVATPPKLELRRASLDDAELLLSWRNDPETLAGSRNQQPVPLANHRHWLAASLANADRLLYIAEVDGQPVGTVRVDLGPDGSELSWTVAPACRGRGYGKQMVRVAVHAAGNGPYWAETRSENIASTKLVEALGFRRGQVHDGVIRWHLENTERQA